MMSIDASSTSVAASRIRGPPVSGKIHKRKKEGKRREERRVDLRMGAGGALKK